MSGLPTAAAALVTFAELAGGVGITRHSDRHGRRQSDSISCRDYDVGVTQERADEAGSYKGKSETRRLNYSRCMGIRLSNEWLLLSEGI